MSDPGEEEYQEGLFWVGTRKLGSLANGALDAIFGPEPPTEEEMRKQKAREQIRKKRMADREVAMCEGRVKALSAQLRREVSLSSKQPDLYTMARLRSTATAIHKAQRELEIEKAHRADTVDLDRDRKDAERLRQRLEEHEDLAQSYVDAAEGLSAYSAAAATREMLRSQDLARQVDATMREGRRDLRSARREQWREERADDLQMEEEEAEEEEEYTSANQGNGRGNGGGLRADPVGEILARALAERSVSEMTRAPAVPSHLPQLDREPMYPGETDLVGPWPDPYRETVRVAPMDVPPPTTGVPTGTLGRPTRK